MTDSMSLDIPIDLSDSDRPIVMVDDEELDYVSAYRFYKRSALANPFVRFEDGIAFLEFLESVKRGENALPVLVLMDINMPRMNGFEAVKNMREDDYFSDVPVVAMLTSSTDTKDKQRAYETGVSGYLVKPFNPREYATFFESLAA